MRGIALLACLLVAGGVAAQEAACTFEDAGAGTVRAVLDGRSFVLTDGREVLLAGIETPGAPANKAALEKILGERYVTLKKLSESKDRYGRLPAFAFIAGDERSAQQTLLSAASPASTRTSATPPARNNC